MDHSSYKETLEAHWVANGVVGSRQFHLVRALKLLKPCLRHLNRTHYSGISLRVKEKGAELADLLLLARKILYVTSGPSLS